MMMLGCLMGIRIAVVTVINGRSLKFSLFKTGGLLGESQLLKPKFSNRLQCLIDDSNNFNCGGHFSVHKYTISSSMI